MKPDVYEPESLSSRGWRLASDMYEVTTNSPGGMSLHGDWFNAWYPEALLDECIKQQLDCHDGNLANGFRLSDTQPGTQVTPPSLARVMDTNKRSFMGHDSNNVRNVERSLILVLALQGVIENDDCRARELSSNENYLTPIRNILCMKRLG